MEKTLRFHCNVSRCLSISVEPRYAARISLQAVSRCFDQYSNLNRSAAHNASLIRSIINSGYLCPGQRQHYVDCTLVEGTTRPYSYMRWKTSSACME